MTTNNNASQTLFRFVSLRNPQLTETKVDNLGFIHRPSGVTSSFDSYVNENDSAIAKFQSIERAAESFTSAFTKESEVETAFPELLKVGRKIAKREKITDQDKNTAANKHTQTTQDQYRVLWDNLMFQTVIQSNFYVKEAVVYVLKALHLGYTSKKNSTEELIKINGADLVAKALEAKVVLPLRFFGDGADHSGSSGVANRAYMVGESSVGKEDAINGQSLPMAVQQQLKIEGERISELSGLNLEKQGLEILKTELEKIQKSHYKLKNKAYDVDYRQYIAEYQPAIDQYNAGLEEIDARIEAGATEAEIQEMYEKLGELQVPSFDFAYKKELNFDDFKAKLSLESLKLFIRMFTDAKARELDFSSISVVSDRKLQVGEIVVAIDEEHDSYADVYELLDEKLSMHTQNLFEKTALNERVYANLGGVLVPVSNRSDTSVSISRTYYLKAVPQNSSNSYVTFYYQAESNAWGVASAKINAITDFNSFEETYSNISVSGGKVTFPSVLLNKFGKLIRVLKIQIFFNNGEEANLEFTGLEMNQPYTGVLYTERIKQEIENPSTPGTTTPKPGNFMPKHFGVKRLGIADYMKVVQTTHAYVPGEVSNIENIMAKEFKQKSTRRLRKSEIQTTASKSTERENLSDTTTTSRNDLQSEVAQVIQQDTNAQAYFRYGGGGGSFEVGGSFATNNAKENSTRQAIAKSQEITEKATERILTKVAEERIEKIIEEFEENNAHGFDNRNGDKHVVGVYRWVDKKMKNQIYNYGKRTMFEFMIPEPAKLHRLASVFTKTATTIKEPIDPRTAPEPKTMPDSKSATEELLKYWADYYKVTLTQLPVRNIVDETYFDDSQGSKDWELRSREIPVPPNYACTSIFVKYDYVESRKKGKMTINVGDNNYTYNNNITYNCGAIENKFSILYRVYYLDKVTMNVKKYCRLSDTYMNEWKRENFDAIIKAYEAAYQDFLVKQKEAEDKAKAEMEEEEKSKGQISNFYREMERVIIKHNCIAFLLQDYLNSNTLGRNLTNNAQSMKEFSIILDENLDQYAALAKFLEQAFEWTIMDYTFYPYYWASRDEWQTMYLSESTDPLFRNFLQAGMARVVITVNPGYEDAVQFFMTTGRIWNGGEVPVIGDPMYMSIVDEMREPLGLKQGKAWITTLPTSLNILQEDAAGLKTLTSLPFTEENPEEFEVPADVVTETDFSVTHAQLNSGENRFIENIDIKNGYLQLTTDDSPREIVAQISIEAIKNAIQ